MAAIELVRKAFQVDVYPVEVGSDLPGRLLGEIPVGYEHVSDPLPGREARSLIGKLEEHGGLGIGVGDDRGSRGLGLGHQLLRGHPLPQHRPPMLPRILGYLPVLAEITAEVAAHGGD